MHRIDKKKPPQPTRLILFNKPFQVLCQFTDHTVRKTLSDYINIPGIYPAGRLDRDSEGLLLLTNNGKLQSRISHPQYKMPKQYLVQVEGVPDENALNLLRTGINLKDGKSAPASVKLTTPPDSLWPRTPPIRYRAAIPTCWLYLTLTEGRNRQVRRMTAATGHPTLRLIRCKIGPYSVWPLSPGMISSADPTLLA